MNKIKVGFDEYELYLVGELMTMLMARNIPELALERLVLLEWWERVYAKHFGLIMPVRMKASLRPSEALAMHRVLQIMPMPAELDVDRQNLMAQIEPKLIPFQTAREQKLLR